MGPEYSSILELASFHSTSKCYMGEWVACSQVSAVRFCCCCVFYSHPKVAFPLGVAFVEATWRSSTWMTRWRPSWPSWCLSVCVPLFPVRPSWTWWWTPRSLGSPHLTTSSRYVSSRPMSLINFKWEFRSMLQYSWNLVHHCTLSIHPRNYYTLLFTVCYWYWKYAID